MKFRHSLSLAFFVVLMMSVGASATPEDEELRRAEARRQRAREPPLGDPRVLKEGRPNVNVTPESIRENHNKRTEQLERLLAEAKAKVADHHDERVLLEEKELTTYTKRVDVYSRKLERMQKGLTDEVRNYFSQSI